MKKTKKKYNITNIVRRVIQILSFVIMPGLFISTFSSIKAVVVALAAGTFSLTTFLPQIAIILAVIPLTMVLGRFFCGFLCSFGALGDLMWAIARKLKIKRIKISKQADGALKYVKYALLVFLAVFVWILGAVTIDASINPWNVFGMYASLSGWSSLAGFLTLGGLFLILIMVGSLFIERMFCRYLCPLGAIFTIVSKLRIIKIKKPTANCGSCSACSAYCSMGIDMSRGDMVNSGECIDCFECVNVCPKDNAKVVVSGQDVAPLAAGAAASVAIAGLYFAGNAVASNVAYAATNNTQVVVTQGETGKYIDGTYTGSASGYRGTTEVEVAIEGGYITSIKVLSTDDDLEFFNQAQSSVISSIISSQDTDVDAVTGATYSAYAIINAVADALGEDAVYEVTGGHQHDHEMPLRQEDTTDVPTPDAAVTEQPPSASTETESAAQEAIANADISAVADGTYTGSGTGFRGTTQVAVTVQDGAIVDIDIVSYADDEPYMDRAESVIDSIISQQEVDVDAVSGATYSSNGIMEAVANALDIEYENTNGEGGRRGHGGRGGGH